jgi:hypothetical protein
LIGDRSIAGVCLFIVCRIIFFLISKAARVEQQ